MINSKKRIKIVINEKEQELTKTEMEQLYKNILSAPLPLPQKSEMINFASIGAQVFDEYERVQDLEKGTTILDKISDKSKSDLYQTIIKEMTEYSEFERTEKYKLLREIMSDMTTAYDMDYLTNGGISYEAMKKFKLLPTDQLLALKTRCHDEYLEEINKILEERTDIPEENIEEVAKKIFTESNEEKEILKSLNEHKQLKQLMNEYNEAVSTDSLSIESVEKFRDGLIYLSTSELIALSSRCSNEDLTEIKRIIGNRSYYDESLISMENEKTRDNSTDER